MGRRTGVALATLAVLAVSAPAAYAAREPLNAYRVAPTAENKASLALAGFDMTEADHGSYLEVYGTASRLAELRREEGIKAKRVGRQRTLKGAASSAAVPPPGSDAAFNVWRRYDKVAGDSKEQYLELYDRLEGKSTVKKVTLGTTRLGRPIVALKVTKNAKAQTDNTRPAVLYNAMQHAREWLAGETCRRTLLYFTDNYGKDTEAGHIVTPLVDSRELWFLCVNNPDGYEYTFTPGNRLWRKNMADNNGNGVYGEVADGVDLNRNHGTNWGRDNEGSSDDPLSETFRGTTPNSEPETRADQKLWDTVDFEFLKNDHTAAELLLYPQGFQQYTPTPDNGIFEALAGDDDQSAIADKTWNAETESWDVTGNRFDPGPLVRALHHQRRRARRRVHAQRHPRLHARGLRARHPERVGLRVPGRRGGHRGGVPAPPAVRARPRRVGRRPGQPGLAHGQHGARLLHRAVRRLLRRPADGPGHREALAGRRQGPLPDQRRQGADRDRPRSGPTASATTRSRASTTTASAGW